MRIDLHTHSNCSDGDRTASDMGRLARDRAVELFALTDHDTWQGYDAAAAEFGGHCVRGFELSCQFEGQNVHLLTFAIAGTDATALDGLLQEAANSRRDRARAMAARLAELGAAIDIEDVVLRHPVSVGRPHLADALLRAGHVTTLHQAYERYLRDGGPAHVVESALDVERGLARCIDAGARVSLAHPHTLEDKVAAVLSLYRDHGITGIEAYYGGYSPRQRQRWLDVARGFNLVATVGSDFHGASYPKVRTVGVDVPDHVGLALARWLEIELRGAAHS